MAARRDERIQRESSGTPWVAGTRKAPETTTAGAADRRHLRPGPRPSLSALLRQAGLCVSAFHPGAPQGRRARFMCSDSHSTTGCPRQRRRDGRTQKRPADSAQVGRRGDMFHVTDPRSRCASPGWGESAGRSGREDGAGLPGAGPAHARSAPVARLMATSSGLVSGQGRGPLATGPGLLLMVRASERERSRQGAGCARPRSACVRARLGAGRGLRAGAAPPTR